MTTYDTYIELVPVETDEQVVGAGIMQFGFERTVGVSGFQKTINKWVKSLLTEGGSDLSDRDYGTGFVKLFGSNVTSRRDVQFAIEFSVAKATSDVQKYQEEYPPDTDDEVLEDVNIDSIVFSQDGTRVDVSVRLENRSGRALRLQIPTYL